MKKPSVGMNSNGMKTFLLHHVEKLVLGGAFLALAFLVWNGWSTEKYTKSEPVKLYDLALKAKEHITGPNNWNEISEFRKGDDEADDRIEVAISNALDSDLYAVPRMLGTPTATLGLRTDPALVRATDMKAKPYIGTVLLALKNNNYVSPVTTLALAGSGDGGGAAGRGGRGGADAGGRGGDGGRGGGRGDDDTENSEMAGDSITNVMLNELVGYRPSGSQGGQPFVLDGVAVTGVVNFGEQFRNYEGAFRNSLGYYPKRDRPIYVYLEVQRRVFDENPADADAYDNAWVDISEQFYDDLYAIEGAPEVVDPMNYDKTITRNIPPLVNLDYRGFSVHPLVSMRPLVPGGMDNRNSEDSAASGNVPNPLGADFPTQIPGVDDAATDGESGRCRGNKRFSHDGQQSLRIRETQSAFETKNRLQIGSFLRLSGQPRYHLSVSSSSLVKRSKRFELLRERR